MFKGLKQLNLPELEEKILTFWRENDIFKKSVENRETPSAKRKSLSANRGEQSDKKKVQKEDKKPKTFRFFEGPPTANGMPGIHHVLARAFKDIILRYKTMRGYYVPRRAGWDTHGLPVEIAVEKELGLKSKPDIEKFGIAPFNERAKASVWRYKDEWEKLTERTGMWLDFKNPYITYANPYVETLWWVFSEMAKRKLLKKSYKVAPFCPRCQTTLSSHELAQPGAYQKAKDPSVYIKFELARRAGADKSSKKKEYLLVWTTTPWTLPANLAVAVNPELTYTKFSVGGEFLWSYNAPPVKPGVIAEAVEKISGKKLVGLSYKPLYDVLNIKKEDGYTVLAADFVETEQGTGLVHIAPAFGEDDFRLIEKEMDLGPGEMPLTIDDQGKVIKGLPGAGKFIKEADKDIMADLEARGIMYSRGTIEHDYPFCWRCQTPLIYFARSSWFVEMSRLRDELMRENEKINWVPAHLKEGRFGEWLKEIKDWNISRERYWGTPLPIWECEKCEHKKIVSSLADLDAHAYSGNKFFVARHGSATHNGEDVIASGIETAKNRSELTKEGIAEVEKMSKQLKKEKIDLIISSPYYRLRQTAKIIAKELGISEKDIVVDKRAGELNAGVFNGRPVREHKDFFEKPILEFTKRPPEGENLNDVKARMMSVILELDAKYRDKKILILSHGDPIWVLEGAARNLSNEEILKYDYIQPGTYRALPLHNWPYNQSAELDLHRPYIDAVFLKCEKCSSKMKRVKEVADVWFDSGCMPFAQWHYPFENKKLIDSGEQYPADYISEGIDQTRGWFYTLLAVATVLERKAPYLNVVSLGLLLDKNGQKMSKSRGNVVDPWAMFKKYGADVVRWHFYTMNQPGEPKRFDENDLLKVYRRFFAIIFNSYVFLETYGTKTANAEHEPWNKASHILDRWILSSLKQLTLDVTQKLDRYEITEAARSIESFVDDLSRWYIRRSRRRFQKPEEKDLFEATLTLRIVLRELAKLIAPFAPFFAEALYLSINQESSKATNQTSAHLTDWNDVSEKEINRDLLDAMAEVRKLAGLGLAKRAETGIKVRQPLAVMKIKKAIEQKSTKARNQDNELLAILKDEVNVKEIVIDSKIPNDVELDTNITQELREEGMLRDFIRTVQELRQAANYKPGEKAMLFVEVAADLRSVIEKNLELFKKETSLSSVEFKHVQKFDAELSTETEGVKMWVGIRK